MKKAIVILLVGFLIGAPTVVLAAKVTSVPVGFANKYNLNTNWYKKYSVVKGVPIVSSARVNSRALRVTGSLINKMLMYKPNLGPAMKRWKIRFGIIGKTERTTQMPEYRNLNKKFPWKNWDTARALSPTDANRLASAPEENILKLGWPADGLRGESLTIHEFAHAIHSHGIRALDPTFDRKLKRLYRSAMKKGLWKEQPRGTTARYAATKYTEYWAVGVQIWYGHTRPRDSLNTREKLKKYDPDLAKLIKKWFGDYKWRFRYGPLNKRTAYKLSTPFGPSLAQAASQNMFMVGEDFDLKVYPSTAAFSFEDYQYIGVDDPAKSAFKLGVKGSTEEGTPNMGGNFALTHQGERATYKVAVDETFLGSKGGGWLSYDNAQSLYVNVGRNFALGDNWTAQGDLTYGVSQAKAKKDSVFQDYSTVHAMGFDVAATYGWTDKDSIQFSASSPLRVEQGSLVIESPYDRERVQLSPNARQLDLGVAYTRKFKTAALTTTLQFTEDSGHYQGQDTTRVMAEYSLSF